MKHALSLLLLLSCIYVTRKTEKDVDRIGSTSFRGKNRNVVSNSNRLPDVMDKLRVFSHFESYSDLFPLLLAGWLASSYLSSSFSSHPAPSLLVTYSLLLLARCVFMRSTILPSSLCDSETRSPSSPLGGGCHDMLFSGHVATTLFLAYVLHTTRTSSSLSKVRHHFLLSYCVVGSVFTILTRSHYTADVLLTWVVTYLVVKEVLPRVERRVG